MISEQAKKGVNEIFIRAARANLVIDPADKILIEPLPATAIVKTPENQIVVLTVASYTFRLLTIFHVGDDPRTTDYFTRSDSARAFREVFGETGNLCCGAINRSLGKHFPHTGMSTPYFLERQCLAFLTELKPSHVAHHRISINDSIVMHATLCFCAYAPVDFRVENETASETTGELELF